MANCVPLDSQKQRLICLILVMLHLPNQKLSLLETSERPLESHTFSNVDVPGHKHNHYIILSQYSVFGIHSFFSQLQSAWASLFLWLCSPERTLFILGSVWLQSLWAYRRLFLMLHSSEWFLLHLWHPCFPNLTSLLLWKTFGESAYEKQKSATAS